MYGIKIKSNNISSSFNIENKKEYFYFFYNLKKNDLKKISFNNSSTIYIVDFKNGDNIKINDKKLKIKKNSSIKVHNLKTIESYKNNIKLFIAGIRTKNKIIKSKISQFSKHYSVKKPWGKELWINNKNDGYSFKKILIIKGFQTSLQFHKKKKETNFLFDGSALLYYSNFKAKKNNSYDIKNYKRKKIAKYSSITVDRNSIHRIKAVSNITLYEISTPELSDVVRILDDSNRKDGKIFSEHK